MSQGGTEVWHRRLGCGLDLAVMPLPGRPVVALEMRVFAGYACEDAEYLGVAQVLEEAISKGTAKRDGRGLNDAFDAIGATHASFAGRETIGFSSLCLPEFLPQVIDLHAEMIRTPTFPEDACGVAVELAQQSLAALGDDPSELVKKLLRAQAYGPPLGRHVLGEEQTLAQIGRPQVVEHWRRLFTADRMQVVVAGPVEPVAVADWLEAAFTGLGAEVSAASQGGKAAAPSVGSGSEAEVFPLVFRPGRWHREKELEQEQVAICFPGAAAGDADFAVQKVMIGVLAGGMSGRLFTEVREKQGLVYWVGAWSDQPRQGGMIHVAASTTPERVDRTYETLLREIARLGEDLAQAELDRAIAGIVTRAKTRGDVTRSRAVEMADDLFHYGRVIPMEEKLARVSAVTVPDISHYLEVHRRDELAVATLGPRALAG